MKRYLIALLVLPACSLHIVTERRSQPGGFTFIEGCRNCPFTMDFPGGSSSTRWYNVPDGGTPILLGPRLSMPTIRDTIFYVNNGDSVRSGIRLLPAQCHYTGVPERVLKRYDPYGFTCIQAVPVKNLTPVAIRRLKRIPNFRGATVELVDFNGNSLFDGPLSVRTFTKIYTANGRTSLCFLSITDRQHHVFLAPLNFPDLVD